MDQLDILKQEMAALKRNLDKEQIVNDKLLRTVMRQRASWLNKFVIAEFIMLPILYLMFVGICAFFNVSQWYALTLLIFSFIDVLVDIRTFRISPKLFSTCTMVEVRHLLIRQKKERFIHMCIALPLAIIWLVLVLSAIANASDPYATDHALNYAGVIGGLIGGLIGGIIVLVIYRKAQRTNDTIIDDIDDERKG
ncbi:MAG: hypothetical protein K2H38_00810 [Muribaculaceae bacterium]|nr:hypothetical protein [Muribaculaceae bacterium]MDE6553577.1 hypothetical protein [Muribaculaceae bacterium]